MLYIKYLLIFFVLFAGLSCKQDSVRGIKIDHTLYTNQSFSENRELCRLIKLTLDKDPDSLIKLIHFDCGGGSGCYDLGFIVTQLVDRMGESYFINHIENLTYKDRQIFENLIIAGLSYGYDETRIIKYTYPQLYNKLQVQD